MCLNDKHDRSTPLDKPFKYVWIQFQASVKTCRIQISLIRRNYAKPHPLYFLCPDKNPFHAICTKGIYDRKVNNQ